MTASFDSIVVGAGVVGLAAARALALAGRSVLVLEAGAGIGRETSSRSSEVIHAGIYYPPGSLKAVLCVAGRRLLYDYCTARGVGHRRIGKLIVACEQAEVRALEAYRARAIANGVDDLAWLTPGQVAGLEPAVRCVAALLSPSTGIVDSHALMLALQADLERAGGTVVLRSRVTGARRLAGGFEVEVEGQPAVTSRELVNAAGHGAVALARCIEGLGGVPAAHCAAGQYFALRGPSPFRHLVYPVAGKAGLGIHVTLDLAGAARFGPDARWIAAPDYRFDDSRREAFAAAIRRYYPALDPDRLEPAYVGVRPRIHGPDDEPADFMIQGPAEHRLAGLVNLYGIESPGLTAALAIGGVVAGKLGAG